VPAVLCLLLACGGCAACGYRGPVTDHFDGRRFHNPGPREEHGFWGFLRWQWTKDRAEWPDSVPVPPAEVLPARIGEGRLRYTFIGHSTVLIQTDGINILTDPFFSERCSPVSWAGPKRVRLPALTLEQLPPIDVVLLGHNHYDHMDLPALGALHERDRPRVLTGLGNGTYLRRRGIDTAEEFDWWEGTLAGPVTIRFVPTRHFSGRGMGDHHRTLWGGFVIESSWGRTYFAGDTGYGEFFRLIREREGPLGLAFLPFGAYEPRWFMKPVHMNPAEAVRAHLDLGVRRTVGIHFGTVQLTDEAIDEPIEALQEALAATDLGDTEFIVPEFGGAFEASGAGPD
jgi:L-ascorbate metabolism protein UlaG (beta-lactamase superfamily)